MPSLKKHIGECIDVDQSSLNEISLDDVRFEENTLICIRRAVMEMLAWRRSHKFGQIWIMC